jgi:hypothetical protein
MNFDAMVVLAPYVLFFTHSLFTHYFLFSMTLMTSPVNGFG